MKVGRYLPNVKILYLLTFFHLLILIVGKAEGSNLNVNFELLSKQSGAKCSEHRQLLCVRSDTFLFSAFIHAFFFSASFGKLKKVFLYRHCSIFNK